MRKSRVPVTTDYSGRLVDLELLQSIKEPDVDTRVYPAITHKIGDRNTAPKMVTGVEKAVQRYFNLLTTDTGSVKFFPNRGGDLVSRVLNGTVSSDNLLTTLFAFASTTALALLNDDDDNEEFGPIPDDERITDATLSSWDIDYASQTVSLHIDLSFASGSTYSFVLPVTSGLT